jgi:hypothetical protein
MLPTSRNLPNLFNQTLDSRCSPVKAAGTDHPQIQFRRHTKIPPTHPRGIDTQMNDPQSKSIHPTNSTSSGQTDKRLALAWQLHFALVCASCPDAHSLGRLTASCWLTAGVPGTLKKAGKAPHAGVTFLGDITYSKLQPDPGNTPVFRLLFLSQR